MQKISVWAPSNIALIKYWGKRDEDLILPHTSSLSMTLSGLGTETSVEAADQDQFVLDEVVYDIKTSEASRVFYIVDLIRDQFSLSENLRIETKNNFPTAAGLASSASGFAALVFALNEFFSLRLSFEGMSRIARQGSGSASRSFWGGFVKWERGEKEDGSDSVGRQLFAADHWPELHMILNVLSEKKKPVSSREGMRRSVETSKLYKSEWLPKNEDRVDLAEKAIQEKDFSALGRLVEENALLMHATMEDASPSFSYLAPESRKLIERVQKMRSEGIEGYVTMDAGPQVKVLCLQENIDVFMDMLSSESLIKKTFVSQPGVGPKVMR